MRTNATVELDAGTKRFASGPLPDLIAALRRSRKGDLVAVMSGDPSIGPELEAWCRFTRNSLIDTAVEEGRTRWVLRYGEAPADVGDDRPVGSRLWLYTNFDCNLSCDYCCVRSSPKAPRRALGIERVRRIAIEAAELGVSEIFVTGGEPFMLPDIGAACAEAAPTTVLTNGMLFAGSRLQTLRSLSRQRVTFQISLDSPTPERHDNHRGKGTWARATRDSDELAAACLQADAVQYRQHMAQLGRRTAVVEGHWVGGSCPNIPSCRRAYRAGDLRVGSLIDALPASHP